MAAVLSSDMDTTDKIVNFISECQKMQIRLLPPHVNTSNYYFSVNGNNELVYGLGAIKGVGLAAIEGILAEREQNGVYRDLYDFCARVDLRKANKRVCEALIYAGAMDGFAENRQTLIATIEDAMKSAEQKSQMQNSGQLDLFGFSGENIIQKGDKDNSHIEIPKWSIKDKLIYEKSVLGMFLSGHLIDEDRLWLNHFKVVPLNRITPTTRKESILLAGVVVSITQRKTKSGKLMGVLQIDDGYERLELVVFSELYDAIRHAINVDQTVVVEGEASIDAYNDQLKINALSVQTIEQYVESGVKSFGLSLEEKELGYLQQFIKNTIDENKALSSKKVQLLVDGDDYRVALSAENLAINVHALAAQSEKFAQHGISLRL